MTTNDNRDSDSRLEESHGLFFRAIAAKGGMISMSFNVGECDEIIFSDVFSFYPSSSLDEMMTEILSIAEKATMDNAQDFSVVAHHIDDGFYAMITPADSTVLIETAGEAFDARLRAASDSSSSKAQIITSDNDETGERQPLAFESHALFVAAIHDDEMLYFPLMKAGDKYLFHNTGASYPPSSKEIQLKILAKTIEDTCNMNQGAFASVRQEREGCFYAVVAPVETISLFPIETVVEAFLAHIEEIDARNRSSSEYLQ